VIYSDFLTDIENRVSDFLLLVIRIKEINPITKVVFDL